MTRIIGAAARGAVLTALVCGALLGVAGAASAALPPIKHVFVVIEENESFATTFGAGSAAPYLSQTLVSQGAFVPDYYGVGHSSLDNYIAMVSGQAPNPSTSADCGVFADFPAPTSMDASGQETGSGCVYPGDVPTLMSQMDSTSSLTWKGYMDDMGADPTRESATCGHPAIGAADPYNGEWPTDKYATRHDPFVYFHSVIDDQPYCDSHVVNLNQLASDLTSVSTTPNFSFITPDVCDDGHDGTGLNCPAGGLAQADTFLRTLVPEITGSPAFKQDGLLIIAFDEASSSDTGSCCGEVSGGGKVGAVLLSPFITAGKVSTVSYNHYSMLGTFEDLFGLPRLADAVGTTAFGDDIFGPASSPGPGPGPGGSNPPPVAPQDSGLKLKPTSFAPRKHKTTKISYRDTQAALTTLTVERVLSGYKLAKHACKVLKTGHKRPKHSKHCTVAKAAGSFTHQDTAGANTLTFNGKLRGHTLVAGAYLLEAAPTLNALTGTTITAHFHVS